MLPSLPPILHNAIQNSTPSYSKGPRGLSVLPQLTSIFTRTSISPGLWLRQWGSRYAIQASQGIHRLTASHPAVFLVNSRYPLFSATATSSGGKPLHQRRHTFSRSYGVNLPNSLATVLSSALVFSTRLPELVCGMVNETTCYEDFLGSMGSVTFRDPKESFVITSRR